MYTLHVVMVMFRENGYPMCELTVVGQAFLWHQIRCIVAVLFLIAQGKEEPEVSMTSFLRLSERSCVSDNSPQREAGGFLSPPCLESQGYQFDLTFLYLLSCSSA